MSKFNFESVYDNIVGFGRTKSISYRMARGAARMNEWHKIEGKNVRKTFKRAVRKAKDFGPFIQMFAFY